jgi:hypothetical protein
MQQQLNVKAIFVSSKRVMNDRMTRVTLFLPPGWEQETGVQSMLQHCPSSLDQSTGLVSLTHWNNNTTNLSSLSTFDEVEVLCYEKFSAKTNQSYVNFDTIQRVRPWQEVVGDETVVGAGITWTGCFLLSVRSQHQQFLSTGRVQEAEWKEPMSDKTRLHVVVRQDSQEVDVRLWLEQAEQLHSDLAKTSGAFKQLLSVHRVPFAVLASIKEQGSYLTVHAIQWDLASFLDERGIRLTSTENLVDSPNVFLPERASSIGKAVLYALTYPPMQTEEQLTQAVQEGTLQCCAMFWGEVPKARGGEEGVNDSPNKRAKTAAKEE